MAQGKQKKFGMIIFMAMFTSLFLLQFVSSADVASYDEILTPVYAIYDFVKYSVTVIAGLVLLFAGITYVASGSDAGKRDKAKNMITYVIVGLIVIWAAPFIVKLVLGT